MVGPDLSDIGSKRKPEHILRSIIDPSAEIEKKYQGILIVTGDGEIKSGLQGNSNEDRIEIIDLEGTKHTYARDDVDEEKVLGKSIMPEGLLEEFTPQQAADLLAFLGSLKK